MIEARDAVRLAIDAFKDITQDTRVEHAFLEEIELVGGNGSAHWAVTISLPPRLPMLGTVMGSPDKEYKVVTIDADSGAFISIKIRSV
jgi:hypothetical protein